MAASLRRSKQTGNEGGEGEEDQVKMVGGFAFGARTTHGDELIRGNTGHGQRWPDPTDGAPLDWQMRHSSHCSFDLNIPDGTSEST